MLTRIAKQPHAVNTLCFLTLVLMLTITAAHPQTISPPDSTTSSTSGVTMGSTGASGTSSSVNASDRHLMQELAHANLSEISMAKLAQSKTTNDQVHSFAQHMIDDHTKALNQLQQLAQTKNVQLPTEPDAKHKASEKRLNGLSGTAFDKQYVSKAGVEDHRQVHRLVEKMSKSARDADVKKLGADLLPSIDQHLQMAQNIRSGKEMSSGMSK